MAHILIVAATEFEILPTLNTLKAMGESLTFSSGKKGYYYSGHTLEILIAGVGMVNTAYQMGKTLHADIDLAINAGIGGSFKPEIAIGSVVQVLEEHLSELGAEDGDAFLDIEQMGFGLSVYKNTAHKGLKHLPGVRAVTVNTVHGETQNIARLVQRLNPDLESMEGAAFMMACQTEGIRCVELRAVSNRVERRNREAWNIPLAIDALNKELLTFLEAL